MPGAFIRPADDLTSSTSSYTSLASPSFTTLPSPRSQSLLRKDSKVTAVGRKRVKLHNSQHDLGYSTPKDLSASYTESNIFPPSCVPSPAPFVNDKYYIAGGLDTPSAQHAATFDAQAEDDVTWDYKSRRYRGANERNSYFPETPFHLSRGYNIKRRKHSEFVEPSWGTTMVRLVGGMINFCWTKTFRGFIAGGGKGYDINSCVLSPMEESSWTDVPPNQDVFNSQYEDQSRDIDSAPGRFPEENFIQDYMSHPESHHAMELSTPTKYNVNADSDFKKWVVVGETDYRSRESSPNRAPRKVPKSAASQPKSISQASVAGRPKLAVHRPSLSSSPALHHERSASYASPRGSPRGPESTPTSRRLKSHASFQSPNRAASRTSLATPASPEVANFERKVRIRNSMENAKINRANRQLQDMIKQGKEALGTKVHVMDANDVEDEGYVEGVVEDAERW